MFSIITPTYNRAAILERALDTMLRMQGIGSCELIVVDDGSGDATPQVLEKMVRRAPGVIRPVRQENAGPGVARNTGLGLAGKERILFLDDDVFPQADLLHAHASLLDRGFDLSQGVLTWHPDLAGSWLMRFMDAHGMQFAFDRVRDDENLPYLYVYTANLAVTRKSIEAVGGFDPALAVKRYAFEDTAFAYCFQKAGRRMGLNRQAMASHYHPMTPEGLAAREYKVGYALGVLRGSYPEIARDLGLDRVSPWRDTVTRIAGVINRTPCAGLFGKEFALRLACRESFGRGMMHYEQQSHT